MAGKKLTAEQIAKYAFDAGFRGQALTDAVAIALAESSGNTGARNPNGEDSRGLWQINVAPSVRKNKWGDLYDPAVNARAAFEVSGGGKNFNPWTTYAGSTEHGRRSSYKNHLEAAKQATSGYNGPAGAATAETGYTRDDSGTLIDPSTGSPVDGQMKVDADGNVIVEADFDLTPDSSPEEIEAYIRKNYPDVAGLMANEEIRKILFDSAIADEDKTEVLAKLAKTEYWQTHGPNSRALDILLAQDRTRAVEVIEAAQATVSDLFAQAGVPLDAATAGEVAKKAIRAGWMSVTSGSIINEAKLNDFLGWTLRRQQGANGGQLPAGAVSANADQLNVIAKQFGVAVSRSVIEDWSLKMLEGTATKETFTRYVQNLAKSQWMHDQDVVRAIDSGISPTQFFDPHRQKIASLLELTDDQVDLFGDPRYSEVTQFFDPNTKARRSMTLGEVEQWTRRRPEFGNTRTYKSTEAEMAGNFARFFGAVA